MTENFKMRVAKIASDEFQETPLFIRAIIPLAHVQLLVAQNGLLNNKAT